MTSSSQNAPFSFKELFAANDGQQQEQQPPHEAISVTASDGIELSVRVYKPSKEPKAALVFCHGGGAYSGAGYQHMALGLSRDFGLTVYLPDIRGHGASGGPRGDAPSMEQVWKDVDAVLEHASQQSSCPLFLGGHSSGGGLVVNYATAHEGRRPVEGYVLVSPELGYKSGTARPDRTDFGKVSILAFIANGICGILGNYPAVTFSYPPEVLADGGMVAFNTVNMANAITPESPQAQLKALCGGEEDNNKNKAPVGLWVGSDDELFVAESVAAYVPATKTNTSVVVPGKNHLGILVGIHEDIGKWIAGCLDQQ